MNTKFKNDYNKTELYVLEIAQKRGFNVIELKTQIDNVFMQIKKLNMNILGEKIKSPLGY